MQIEFNTSQYVASHGKEPRGYGMWAFFPDRQMRIEDAVWSPAMTYANAKKWMRKHPKVGTGPGYIEIYVGS